MTLQLRTRTTAGGLAKQLGISERTIYRDVEALEGAGVPIVTDRGRSGGLRLIDGYQTRLTGLSGQEAEALPFAEIRVVASALGLDVAAEGARLKVFAALPTLGRERALRASERFHLDPAEWYQRPATPACLKPLASAVLADQVVAIDYESWRGRKVRVVEPLGLVLKAATWYMVAPQPKTIRHLQGREHSLSGSLRREVCSVETSILPKCGNKKSRALKPACGVRRDRSRA